ncbi:MAG TPA: aldo/keto reductase [Candidatus Baltobacteraceae bacterium]|nr:aldo/keto reductase [Candidatus Baltobacteraceae bacterium]
MNDATVGKTAVTVTRIGCGGAPLGGLFEAVSEEQAQETLAQAWASGVRYFDTAPLYGYGLSEERLGRFLSDKSRDAFTVSTKVGRVLVPKSEKPNQDGSLASFRGALPFEAVFDFSADGIRRSIEASLQRLQLSRVDIIYIHDPEHHLEQAIHEAYPALLRLREEGVTRAIGVGMNQTQPLERFVRECNLDAVMIAGRYTLLDRSALDDLLPACAQRGVSVIAAGVFNSGILAEREPRAGATYDYRIADAATLARTQVLYALCRRYGVSMRSAAIQFPLSHPAITSVVLGMRTPAEVREDLAALERPLPPTLLRELNETAHA